MDNTHYKISELKELGWTDKLIEKYLGEPDKLVENPVYKSKPPMRLYAIERVEHVTEENNLGDTLESNLQKRGNRSASALAAANTKRQKILNWVGSLTIEIPKWEYEDLIDLACDHYNERLKEKARDSGQIFIEYEKLADSQFSDPNFIYRICHNFLRHEASEYERLLTQLFGQVGKDNAYNSLRSKITSKINETYPELLTILNARYEASLARIEQQSLKEEALSTKKQ